MRSRFSAQGSTVRYHSGMDRSSGYEAIAGDFLPRRGRTRSVGMGVPEVRNWARTLPRGSSVLDLGCGPGFPITSVLVDEGLAVFGVDASLSLVSAFQKNLPGTPILCEAVQESGLFDRTFEAVLAWGFIFLLNTEDQRRLIRRFSEILASNGHLLFTSPTEPVIWNDAMTGMESVSLGAAEYRRLLKAVNISIHRGYKDVGGNYYYDAVKNA